MLHDDDGFDQAGGLDLMRKLDGGDEGDASAAVAQLSGGLVGGQRGKHRHIDRTDGEAGEIGYGPLPAILCDERDAVALGHALGLQPGSQPACAPVQRIARDGLPGVPDLGQDRAFCSARDRVNEDVIERSQLHGWRVPLERFGVQRNPTCKRCQACCSGVM